MSARSNGSLEPKRVAVEGEFVASLVAEVARRRGYRVQVGYGENADLTFVEVLEAAELVRLPRTAPVVAMVPRNLRRGERAAFRSYGARAVLDREANLLDLLDALSTGLFATRADERRYARSIQNANIRYTTADGRTGAGQLLQTTHSGAVVVSHSPVVPGVAVCLELQLGDRPVLLRGRTVCRVVGSGPEGFGVEFAHDAAEVAPRIASLSAGFEPLPAARTYRANAS